MMILFLMSKKHCQVNTGIAVQTEQEITKVKQPRPALVTKTYKILQQFLFS